MFTLTNKSTETSCGETGSYSTRCSYCLPKEVLEKLYWLLPCLLPLVTEDEWPENISRTLFISGRRLVQMSCAQAIYPPTVLTGANELSHGLS